jgi:hypothetical protein
VSRWRSATTATTALGLGALVVLLTGIGAAVVHDDPGAGPTARVVTQPAPSPTTAVPTADGGSTTPAVVRHRHHAANVLGEQRHRTSHRGHSAPAGAAPVSDALPFTGPAPLAPTLALGLLLLAAGMWLIASAPSAGTLGIAVRYDATRGLAALARSSRTLREPRGGDAIGRLRLPR